MLTASDAAAQTHWRGLAPQVHAVPVNPHALNHHTIVHQLPFSLMVRFPFRPSRSLYTLFLKGPNMFSPLTLSLHTILMLRWCSDGKTTFQHATLLTRPCFNGFATSDTCQKGVWLSLQSCKLLDSPLRSQHLPYDASHLQHSRVRVGIMSRNVTNRAFDVSV